MTAQPIDRAQLLAQLEELEATSSPTSAGARRASPADMPATTSTTRRPSPAGVPTQRRECADCRLALHPDGLSRGRCWDCRQAPASWSPETLAARILRRSKSSTGPRVWIRLDRDWHEVTALGDGCWEVDSWNGNERRSRMVYRTAHAAAAAVLAWSEPHWRRVANDSPQESANVA